LLVDEEGKERLYVASCTGGSQNELPFALKDMEVSAIGNAVSKMRFQELVYMGKLSHRNVRQFLAGRERVSGGNGRAEEGAEATEFTREYSCGDFVVSIGKYEGKRLAIYDEQAEDLEPGKGGGLPKRQAHYVTLQFLDGKTADGTPVSIGDKDHVRVTGYLRDAAYSEAVSTFLRKAKQFDRIKERDDEVRVGRAATYVVAKTMVRF
jgi:hypothetical protein